jgi:cytosine/adenosine deaminase-related metal-dependent hydrolase
VVLGLIIGFGGLDVMSFSIRVGLAVVGFELSVKFNVCVFIRDGVIESIEGYGSCSESSLGSPSLALLPQPGNAHVHSADHAFPEYGIHMSLRDLVAPPHGLKHKLLESTPGEDLVKAISEFYDLAWRMGLGILFDFREGGGLGCMLARKARELLPRGLRVVIQGRPGPMWPEGCEGLGVSSPLDYNVEFLREMALKHKPAMAHVAEDPEARAAGDLERAVEVGLDAIVHGTHLSEGDLEVLKERGMALVLCPRSNMWHSIGVPPVAEALIRGVTIAFGSDNAAWQTPDVWAEAQTALLLARAQGLREEWTAKRILEAIMITPYLLAGAKPPAIVEGGAAKMIIVNLEGTGVLRARNHHYAILKRVGPWNTIARIDGEGMAWLTTVSR